jgi:hypothetical protein
MGFHPLVGSPMNNARWSAVGAKYCAIVMLLVAWIVYQSQLGSGIFQFGVGIITAGGLAAVVLIALASFARFEGACPTPKLSLSFLICGPPLVAAPVSFCAIIDELRRGRYSIPVDGGWDQASLFLSRAFSPFDFYRMVSYWAGTSVAFYVILLLAVLFVRVVTRGRNYQ